MMHIILNPSVLFSRLLKLKIINIRLFYVSKFRLHYISEDVNTNEMF
jgi:hypothetical protein